MCDVCEIIIEQKMDEIIRKLCIGSSVLNKFFLFHVTFQDLGNGKLSKAVCPVVLRESAQLDLSSR